MTWSRWDVMELPSKNVLKATDAQMTALSRRFNSLMLYIGAPSALPAVLTNSSFPNNYFRKTFSCDWYTRSLYHLLEISSSKPTHTFISASCRRFSVAFSLFKVLHCKRKIMPAKILVEYAKSGRAACKGCGNTIAKGCMRLGIVSKAAGGFDMTRWYHLQCLPSQSEVVSAENINGFPLLKALDQEALKALVAEFGKQSGSPVTGNEDSQQKPVKSITEEMCGDDQGIPKKLKVEHASIKSCGHDDVGFLDMLSPSELRSRYKDAILPPKWKAFQTVIFLEQEDGLKASEKIAAFDFDGCLVKTSVRKVGADAWSLHYSTIPEKLQGYYNKGYKLVIFTNESNIDRWKNSRQKAVDSKLGRLEGFINRVKVPMQVFVACGIEGTGDAFRKPKSGMWRLMERHFNSGIVIDMEQSFYVGDAAGRIDDHSDADIGFAKGVGLKFHLPEDFFAPEA